MAFAFKPTRPLIHCGAQGNQQGAQEPRTTPQTVLFLAMLIVWAGLPANADLMLTGEEFAQMVSDRESPEGITLTDVTITGPVDLRNVERIDRPIRCDRCVVEGQVLARDIAFTEIVAFIDSTFEQKVDFQGSLFSRSVIFDHSHFHSGLVMTSTRFEELGSFADVRVDETSDFRRAAFKGQAVFNSSDPLADRANEVCRPQQAAFLNTALFSSSSFSQRADFRGRCFQEDVIFRDASFEGGVDFTSSSFFGSSTFDRVNLASGGDFRAVDFYQDAFFRAALTGNVIDFTGASARGRIDFTGFRGGGTLVLANVRVPGSGADPTFVMNDLSVSGLVFDPSRVDHVGGPAVQREVLELVQETADRNGEIELANDAQFQLLALRAENLGWLQRGLDWLFYRTIAGYLVRPLHPLLSIVALIVFAGTIRLAHKQYERRERAFLLSDSDKRSSDNRRPRRRRRRRRIVFLVADAFSSYSEAMRMASSSRPGETVPEENEDELVPIRDYLASLLRFLEWLSYRILIAVALIGVANSLPIVKELIDAIF